MAQTKTVTVRALSRFSTTRDIRDEGDVFDCTEPEAAGWSKAGLVELVGAAEGDHDEDSASGAAAGSTETATSKKAGKAKTAVSRKG